MFGVEIWASLLRCRHKSSLKCYEGKRGFHYLWKGPFDSADKQKDQCSKNTKIVSELASAQFWMFRLTRAGWDWEQRLRANETWLIKQVLCEALTPCGYQRAATETRWNRSMSRSLDSALARSEGTWRDWRSRLHRPSKNGTKRVGIVATHPCPAPAH